MAEYDDLPYIVIERRSGGHQPLPLGRPARRGRGAPARPALGRGDAGGDPRRASARLRAAAEDRVNEARDTVTGAVTRTRDRIQDQIDTRARDRRGARRAGARQPSTRAAAPPATPAPSSSAASTRPRSATRPPPRPPATRPAAHPAVDVVVTEVVVEEAERASRPRLAAPRGRASDAPSRGGSS